MEEESMPNPTTLDCRGKACPEPVMQCKQAIEADHPEFIAIVVDNDAAKENVTRFLGSHGYAVTVSGEAGNWTISGARDALATPPQDCDVMDPAALANVGQKILVFLPAATMGSGDDGLGAKLMAAFLKTLPEMGNDLWRIVLVNGGVQLSTGDSPVLESLQALEQAGADILVCGTCLEHFGLTDAKAVGQTTNMLDIVTSMQLATKVIRV